MASHPLIDRLKWFEAEIKRDKFPNATLLSEKFEVSRKTAQRDISKVKEEYNAPLQYDKSKKGYFYSNPKFTLFNLNNITQEEILAILLAKNLLSSSAGGLISQLISEFGKKLFIQMGNIGLSENTLDESFSATWHGYSPSSSDVFRIVSDSLINSKLLYFSYSSPIKNKKTERTVEPHHLQHYMGSWVLIAFCRERDEWRKFHLSRMSNIKTNDKIFVKRPKKEWECHILKDFGIFFGKHQEIVTLRFNPFRARWIKDEFWHPAQTIKELEDGSLDLSFPVADLREVKLKTMQYGADVEVMQPESLKTLIKDELLKMNRLYGVG